MRKILAYSLGAVLSAGLFVATTGTAGAADLVGNSAFNRPGEPVYATNVAGIGCTAFGMCDGLDSDDLDQAVPRRLSERGGQPVVALCTVRTDDIERNRPTVHDPARDVVKIELFDLTGWTRAAGLRSVPDREC